MTRSTKRSRSQLKRIKGENARLMDEKTEVLIIEDDSDIRNTIRILLECEGFEVREASSGEEGLKMMSPQTELVILDVMMPGMSGYETCENIRKFSYVPILFLTAKNRESDKLEGFNSGGDDYLVKPFSFSELTARVRALLRRHKTYDANLSLTKSKGHWLTSDELRLNCSFNQLFINDQEIKLTETEYAILLLLMSYPNKVFSVQNIYESIWNESFVSSYSNSVMVHIRNLRAKIEPNPQVPKYVLTVWGKGYRFG